jgi:hypothetical protein
MPAATGRLSCASWLRPAYYFLPGWGHQHRKLRSAEVVSRFASRFNNVQKPFHILYAEHTRLVHVQYAADR